MSTPARGTSEGALIQWTTNLQCVATAELVIESIVEDLPLKRKLVGRLAQVCSAETILTTNSSYFLPSAVFQGVPKPERIASLHFHVPPWFATAVDIMPTMRTSETTMDTLEHLIASLGLTPIRLLREFPGYIFNSLLHPLLVKSLEIAHRGVASPETVDLAWRAVTGMPTGPFGMMQQIGTSTLSTILDRALAIYQDEGTRRARAFLEQWSGVLESTQPTNTSLVLLNTTLPRSSPRTTKFAPYRQVWQFKDTQLDASRLSQARSNKPTQNFQVLGSSYFASRLALDLNGIDITVSQQELEASKTLVWVIDPTDEERLLSSANLFSREKSFCIQTVSYSDSVSKRIETLRGLLEMFDSASKPTKIVVILPLDASGQLFRCGWGAPAMLRSAWLEQFGLDGSVLSPMNLQILSVDFLETNAVQCVADRIRSHASFAFEPPDQISECAGKVDRTEVYSRLHFQFDRNAWGRPKLVPCVHERMESRSHLDTAAQDERVKSELDRSTWIVSGGGRGITAHLARKLAEYGARLVLLGRTKEPPDSLYEWSAAELSERKKSRCRDAFNSGQSPAIAANLCDHELELSQNLNWLRRRCVDFEYQQIDVTSLPDLQSLKTCLNDRGTAIDGILHGAGFEQTTRLLRKSDESIRRTLACKIDASIGLASLIGRHSKWYIQCGSLSGFFGGAGQVDYSLANGFQACFAESLAIRWPDVQSLTIAWPGWSEVGMSARPASAWALGRTGHALMRIEEGTTHFIDLLKFKVSGCVFILPHDEIPNQLL